MSTTPERELPDEMEQAIGQAILTAVDLGELPQKKRPASDEAAAAITAEVKLRHAIAAAALAGLALKRALSYHRAAVALATSHYPHTRST